MSNKINPIDNQSILITGGEKFLYKKSLHIGY